MEKVLTNKKNGLGIMLLLIIVMILSVVGLYCEKGMTVIEFHHA